MKPLALLLLAAALLLAACFDDNPAPTAPTAPTVATEAPEPAPQNLEPYLACADVTKDGGIPCEGQGALTDFRAPRTVDAGTISRGAGPLMAFLDSVNPAPQAKRVGIEFVFDGGCNPGEPYWIVAAVQFLTVPAQGNLPIGVGGSCSGMPTGPRTLTASLYDEGAVGTGNPYQWTPEDNAEFLLDRVIVEFNLVE